MNIFELWQKATGGSALTQCNDDLDQLRRNIVWEAHQKEQAEKKLRQWQDNLNISFRRMMSYEVVVSGGVTNSNIAVAFAHEDPTRHSSVEIFIFAPGYHDGSVGSIYVIIDDEGAYIREFQIHLLHRKLGFGTALLKYLEIVVLSGVNSDPFSKQNELIEISGFISKLDVDDSKGQLQDFYQKNGYEFSYNKLKGEGKIKKQIPNKIMPNNKR